MSIRAEHLWVLATLELGFILAASTPIVPPDIWWTLKAGEIALSEGRLVVEQVFAFAPARAELVNVQWLAQVVLYGVYAVGGLELLIFLNAVIAVAVYGGLLWLCWRASGSVRLACLATFVAYLLGMSNLGARPQMLAYPLFLSCYALLWMQRAGGRQTRLLALPPLVVVWANVHGSFVLGPVLVSVFLAGHVLEHAAMACGGLPARVRAALKSSRTRNLAIATLGSLAATLVNPYGPAALVYVATLSGNEIIRRFVTEWAPTTVESWYGQLYFASLAFAAAVVYATRSHRRLTATEVLLLLAFGYLGLASVRGIIWWGLVMAPILAVQLAAAPRLRALAAARRAPRGAALLSGIVLSIAALGIIGSLPWLKAVNPLVPPEKRALVGPETPVAVAAYLNRQPAGARLFNYQGWGGYFDWSLWPRHQPFVDGRIEVHPDRVWLDYLTISFGHAEWETLLDTYAVSHLVLSKTHQRDLIELAGRSPRWRELYTDEQAVVFERSFSP